MLLRPCLLVLDQEFAGTISTRKLVLESAKLNVITAYSYKEALAALERFPRLHGIVVTADRSGEAEAFLHLVKKQYPQVKRILTGELPDGDFADVRVESFAPDKLLSALRELFTDAAKSIEKHETELMKDVNDAVPNRPTLSPLSNS